MNKITITYGQGMEELLSHNLGLSENSLREKLASCFEQKKIIIEEVLVKIVMHSSESDAKYTCQISIVSPDIDFNLEEKNKDYSQAIHLAIEKTLFYIHNEKEKIADNT